MEGGQNENRKSEPELESEHQGVYEPTAEARISSQNPYGMYADERVKNNELARKS